VLVDTVPNAQIVAVGFAGDKPVLQLREPNSLIVGERGVVLPGDSIADTGSMLFHLRTGSGLACASCHPEGQEDGHTWSFQGFGKRRTQSLRGGLLGTEPLHWDGLEQDFKALATDVMQGRMSGPGLSDQQIDALSHFVDRFAAIPATVARDATRVARGKELFEDGKVGCATCHSGARFSNDKTVDVGGKGELLQVPSLVGLWARAPYLHDGCAATIADRFSPACDSGKHGDLTGLSSEDVGALGAYLETL
jgi:cytochrome c